MYDTQPDNSIDCIYKILEDVRKDVSFIRLEQTKMALLARLRGKLSSEDYAILHQIITCMDEQLTIACGYLYNKNR